MNNFRNDIRIGLRQVRRNPGVTVIAVLALALGIGLTTTVFSMVYGMLLRGLPFDAPEEIVHIDRTDLARGVETMAVSIHDFHDWRERQHSFSEIAAFYYGTVNVSGGEQPERYSGAFVTGNTFDLLRVQPLLGRTLRPGDDAPGAEPVIVLGYNVWRDRFASDPNVIGTSLRANGEAVTVIGVMPERFAFPYVQQMWLPLRLQPLAIPRGKGQQVEVFGRLRAGVSIDRANVEMNEIARALAAEHPASNEGIGVVVQTFIASIAGEGIQFMYTMLGAVLLVLLVACANVANLLLGRAAARSREVAVRTALGATRGRVVAQFLSETFVLAALGAALGIGVAFIGVRLVNNALHSFDDLPFFIDVKLDGAALLFVLSTTLLATLAAGILPALQAARADAGELMKDAARGSSSFRIGRTSRAVVVLEMALSCGLLVVAGLMIRSITNLSNADYIFHTDDIFTARVGLPEGTYADSASQHAFYDELQTRLSALPGVTAASLASGIPVAAGVGAPRREAVAIDGRAYARDSDYQLTGWLTAAPGYFDALGVALLGRDFAASDRAQTLPVAIVNQSFVRRYFADVDPIGRRVRMGKASSTEPWRTIIGVVPDLYLTGADNKDPDGVYVPLAQSPQRFMTIVLRTSVDPLGMTAAVRDVVADIDADLPIYFVNSLTAQIDDETWFYRLFGAIFTIFGFVALALASIGLYAVTAFSVKRRTRELGIRVAVGANVRQVLQLILGQGLRQIAIGLVFGLVLAALLSQLLAGLLFEVDPQDPLVFAGVVLTLVLTGLAACLVPALRAARVDPMVAIRAD